MTSCPSIGSSSELGMDHTQVPLQMIEDTTESQENFTQLVGNHLASTNHSPLVFLVIIMLIIAPGTIFSNMLMIRVLYRLHMSKLRKTTKLLLGYVSTSHCVLGIGSIARLFNVPCSFLALLIANTGINLLNGQFLLACEVFVMVLKPYSYQRIFTFRICKLAIFLMSATSMALYPAAYLTRKQPADSALKKGCYMTNGMFDSLLMTITISFVALMVLLTAIIQAIALFKVHTSAKKSPNQGPTVGHTNSLNQPVPAPNMPAANQGNAPPVVTGGKSRLHRLTVILAVSLLCFIVCWSPTVLGILIFSIYDQLGIEVSIDSKLMPAFSPLIIINGALHVGVYLFMSTEIRNGMRNCIKHSFCDNECTN